MAYNPTKSPRIDDVKAFKGPDYTLLIKWDDGREDTVNLSGLIEMTKGFDRFKDDPSAFLKPTVSSWGYTVEWPNGVDWPAPNFRSLADAQRPRTGQDLKKFISANNVSVATAADAFGVSKSTIKGWRLKGTDKLPASGELSLKYFESNPIALVARIKPRRAGRPLKSVE